MSTSHQRGAGAWTLEAPNGARYDFHTRREAKSELYARLGLSPSTRLQRFAPGAYGYTVCLPRGHERTSLLWLIYSPAGLRWLRAVQAPAPPIEPAAPAADADRPSDGV